MWRTSNATLDPRSLTSTLDEAVAQFRPRSRRPWSLSVAQQKATCPIAGLQLEPKQLVLRKKVTQKKRQRPETPGPFEGLEVAFGMDVMHQTIGMHVHMKRTKLAMSSLLPYLVCNAQQSLPKYTVYSILVEIGNNLEHKDRLPRKLPVFHFTSSLANNDLQGLGKLICQSRRRSN